MKKITHHEANYIMRRTKPHRFERLTCNWYIEMLNKNGGILRCYMKLWAYTLLFIPAHIAILLHCIWDGGLKEFSIQDNTIHSYVITGLTTDDVNTEFGRFRSVWRKVK